MTSQYHNIIPPLLRAYTFYNNAGNKITSYTTQAFKKSKYKNTPIKKIKIPNDINLKTNNNDNITFKKFTKLLQKNIKINNSLNQAIQINKDIYLIHKRIASKNKLLGNKIIFITGAAQGFGKGIAKYFVQEGAFVYIADIDLKKAKATAKELSALYNTNNIRAIQIDCNNQKSIQKCASVVIQESGGLDVLISNAGIVISGSTQQLDLAAFEKVTNINYTGYFLLVKYFSPCMQYQHMGNNSYYSDIIQINSKSGLQGSLNNSAYAGSKFGGLGLTQSFALELVNYNIKVNSICPGNFYDGPLWSDPKNGLFAQYLAAKKIPHAKTIADVRKAYEEKTPMKRGCTIEDVVKGIVYLIDQKFETGQALPISGGQVMLH